MYIYIYVYDSVNASGRHRLRAPREQTGASRAPVRHKASHWARGDGSVTEGFFRPPPVALTSCDLKGIKTRVRMNPACNKAQSQSC